jgi:hypothetical protein
MTLDSKSVHVPSADEKALISQIENKHGKTIVQLLSEREKRVRDAIELKVPDRVPVVIGTGVFAARYAGLTASSLYYDHAAYRAASKKMLLDFEPDNGPAGIGSSGLALQLLDAKQYRWPGGTLPADGTYQFIEGEYMKADEYDHFLSDPVDFIVRRYLPRTYGAFEMLAGLEPVTFHTDFKGLADVLGMLYRPDFNALTLILGNIEKPELNGILNKLRRIRKEQLEMAGEAAAFYAEMERLGFPSGISSPGYAGSTFAPFDSISDRLRGMRGTMIDMYRNPEKLLIACDRIFDWEMRAAVPAKPDNRGNPSKSGMPLHRGSDGFMSHQDFRKFYWPTLKKVIEKKIDLGYIVIPFFEGIWDDRLEYLLELPKGKVVFYCEKTDIFKAKKVLGNHMCIQGGVPPTILQTGSPQDVEEYCKKLCQIIGKNGGFILSAGSVLDFARPDNVMAMVNAAKKYGTN